MLRRDDLCQTNVRGDKNDSKIPLAHLRRQHHKRGPPAGRPIHPSIRGRNLGPQPMQRRSVISP